MYASISLIIINIACYFFALDIEHSELIFGLSSLFMSEKFYWQPLSSMFMHGDLTHLAMNMVVLFQFGVVLERSRGAKFFLILYFLGGLLTSLLTFAFMQLVGFDHVVVGASGALCVMIGYLAFADESLRKGLLVAVLIISFVPSLFGMNIAWYAHLIGFGIGYFYGKIQNKKYNNNLF